MSRLAVVGTGTGVGKTVVTAGLVGRLRRDGVDARAVKPAQTGYPPDDDAAFVRDACGDDAAATCLRYLEEPLAPAVAADRAGVDMEFDALRRSADDELSQAEVGIMEGVGGLRVPLAGGDDIVDLVAALDCPAVVVARSGLGTLNHTALTVESLERRGIPIRGVVLNDYAGASVAERTNPDVLAEMIDYDVETLPTVDLTEESAAVDAVVDHLPRFVSVDRRE